MLRLLGQVAAWKRVSEVKVEWLTAFKKDQLLKSEKKEKGRVIKRGRAGDGEGKNRNNAK